MTLEFTPAGFDAFQNNITDVSTVLIGAATSTGTASQPLQVGSATTQLGAYISGNLGIGTTNPSAKLQVVGNTLIQPTTAFTVQGDTNINNTLPSTISYVSSFSVATQETDPRDVFFSNDGKTMYVLGNSSDDITWYTLSTPWDITTSTHVSQFSIASQLTLPTGFYFKPDGTKFYVVGTTGVGAAATSVNQYSCRTPWDLTTASYDSVAYSVISQDTVPQGVEFKPDGTRMYVVGSTNDRIYQYSLSTPWDLTTVSYGSSFSVTSQESTPEGIRFSFDGTKLLLTGSNGDDVNYYTLSTPWNITTTSFVGVITSVGAATTLGETSPSGLYWKPDGTRLYLSGLSADTIYQFNMTSNADLEVTGKTSLYGDLSVYESTTLYSDLNVNNIVGIGTTTTALKLKIQGDTNLTGGFNATGSVGIGITNPTANLQVSGTTLLRGNNGINTATNPNYSGTWFSFDSVSNVAQITAVNASTASLAFYTKSGSGSAPAERVRITSDGSVGIGTINPLTLLHLNSTDPTIRLRRSDAATNAYGEITSDTSGLITLKSDPGNVAANSGFSLTVDNTQAVRVSAAGSVGVGITNPSTKLHVVGGGTSTDHLYVAGVSTTIDTRIHSVAEKSTRVSGNTINLVYNTGSGNIAICTNPTGNITLNVNGIPTDSNFDNLVLTFSVIVNNTGTARSCTAVNLNGYPTVIRWAGGSLPAAIAGITTTTGIDIYSFTGINTIGSASTTSNYSVLGVVNGGYR